MKKFFFAVALCLAGTAMSARIVTADPIPHWGLFILNTGPDA